MSADADADARKEDVIKILRSLLISCKGSLSLKECNRDYKEIEGEYIPFKELGFKSLEELFKSIPGFKVNTSYHGEIVVDAEVTEETRHIANLIAKSKTKSRGRFGPPNRSFREKHVPKYVGPSKIKNKSTSSQNNTTAPPRLTNRSVSVPASTTPSPAARLNIKPADLTKNNTPIIIKHDNMINTKEDKKSNGEKEYSNGNNSTSGAAARLLKLQNNLKIEAAPPVFHKIEEKPPKNAQEELIRYCRDSNLPEPIYKYAEIIAKRAPMSYDCSLKVGKYSFNTYPDSLASRELAAEKVSKMALEELKKDTNTENGDKPLSDPKKVVQKITELVASHSTGLFVTNVPEQFRNRYNEQLPENWLSLVKNCREISIEQGACGSEILWHTKQENNSGFGPPPLVYPDEDWPVYIMEVFSPLEVWLRIIGPEYSDEYDNLLSNMFDYFTKKILPCEFLVKDRYYAVQLGDDWYRCKILSIDHREAAASCFLIDLGIEDAFPIKSYYELPPQFLKLPAQAIFCSLDGLQDYVSLDVKPLQNMLIEKTFRCEIIETPNENCESFTIDLFDTSTSENIKISSEYLKNLFNQIKPPKILPNTLTKIYVVDVKSSDNINIQVRDENWKLFDLVLNNFIKNTISSNQPFTPIRPHSRCIAKSSNGEWLRAEVISKDTDAKGLIPLKFIDWSFEERVSPTNIFPLDNLSKDIASLPIQVMQVSLYNTPQLNRSQLDGLEKLVLKNETVVCKLMRGILVRLFARVPPVNIIVCVNDTFKLESELENVRISTPSPKNESVDKNGERREKKPSIIKNNSSGSIQEVPLISGKVSQFPLPKEGNYFDIKIINAVSPQNFIVQPVIHEVDLDDMMSNLQIYYKTFSEIPSGIDIGSVYAAYHGKMQCWCRANVTKKFSNGSYVVHFIDFGDYLLVDVDKIRKLPKNFLVLPSLAIKAELYGVSPSNGNWTVDDCMKFEKLVQNKKFMSTVMKITYDEHQPEELVSMDIKLKTQNGEIYLYKMLENEGICLKG